MNNKQTQLNIVIEKLMEEGQISRNWCLSNFLTRLASRIRDLKDADWLINGKKEGNDYIYTLEWSPLKKVEYKTVDEGRVIKTAYELK